jgi:hypothetical protein
MTNVERKMASSETISLSVGPGLFSEHQLPDAEDHGMVQTNGIEPASRVIASATRAAAHAPRDLSHAWSGRPHPL